MWKYVNNGFVFSNKIKQKELLKRRRQGIGLPCHNGQTTDITKALSSQGANPLECNNKRRIRYVANVWSKHRTNSKYKRRFVLFRPLIVCQICFSGFYPSCLFWTYCNKLFSFLCNSLIRRAQEKQCIEANPMIKLLLKLI